MTSIPFLMNVPARPYADPARGIRLTSGYRPERLRARLEEAFHDARSEPAPEAERWSSSWTGRNIRACR